MDVLVTGCDTDLGRTIAASFSDAGHTVVLAGSRRDELDVAVKRHDATPTAAADSGPGGGGLRFTEYEKPAEPVRRSRRNKE